jgi:hypothetical protein
MFREIFSGCPRARKYIRKNLSTASIVSNNFVSRFSAYSLEPSFASNVLIFAKSSLIDAKNCQPSAQTTGRSGPRLVAVSLLAPSNMPSIFRFLLPSSDPQMRALRHISTMYRASWELAFRRLPSPSASLPERFRQLRPRTDRGRQADKGSAVVFSRC